MGVLEGGKGRGNDMIIFHLKNSKHIKFKKKRGGVGDVAQW